MRTWKATEKLSLLRCAVFETQLVAIGHGPNEATDQGKPTVTDEEEEAPEAGLETAPAVQPNPKASPTVSSNVDNSEAATTQEKQDTEAAPPAAESQQPVIPPPHRGHPDEDNGKDPGSVDGECRLLGPFALVVQAGLGLLAIFSLVWKRWRERPRRPFRVWFFDVSKQVFGSVLLHTLNILMSMFSIADLELAHKAKELSAQLQDADGRQVNPCSWYLINIAIDVGGGRSPSYVGYIANKRSRLQ